MKCRVIIHSTSFLPSDTCRFVDASRLARASRGQFHGQPALRQPIRVLPVGMNRRRVHRCNSDSVCVPTVTLGGARQHQPHWLQFAPSGRFLSEEFLVCSELWRWQLWLKQVGHESQFMARSLAPIIHISFLTLATHTHTHRCCSDFTQLSLALTLSPNL